MSKIVAIAGIDNSTMDLLRNKGYELVDVDYEGNIDTILYDSNIHNMGYLSVFDSIIDMGTGAFLVDINNKNIDEIVSTIDSRSYGSLF